MTDPHHAADDASLTEAGDPHAPIKPSDDFVRSASLLKVVDGDTYRMLVELGWGVKNITDIRLTGVNTPEHRGPERPAGLWVTEQVKSALEGFEDALIHSKVFSVGKFGRCLCDLWMGDLHVNRWLLESGYAWLTDRNGSMIGPRDINLLTGIPADIREQVGAA